MKKAGEESPGFMERHLLARHLYKRETISDSAILSVSYTHLTLPTIYSV